MNACPPSKNWHSNLQVELTPVRDALTLSTPVAGKDMCVMMLAFLAAAWAFGCSEARGPASARKRPSVDAASGYFDAGTCPAPTPPPGVKLLILPPSGSCGLVGAACRLSTPDACGKSITYSCVCTGTWSCSPATDAATACLTK